MNTLLLPASSLLALLLTLSACDTVDSSLGEATALADAVAARGEDRCVIVNHTGEAALGAPVVIPIADPPLVGGGGLPTPTQIGPYSGLLSSILLSEAPAGNGAVHYTLVHYFVEDGTGDAFWTDDRAVCSPVGNDPSKCLVNDRLEVVGGTGKFEGASGRLHNRGLITTFDPIPQDGGGVVFGSLGVNLRGRVCGDGL